MSKKKLVKIELRNPRYHRTELRDHASEFILYSRYSGFLMEDFNEHLRNAKLLQMKSDFMESFKIELETYIENARILYQLTKLYPSFSNWKIRAITPGVDITTVAPKMPKPEKKKRKPAAKTVSKKKPGSAAKKPAPKKAAKKKPAPKPNKRPAARLKKRKPALKRPAPAKKKK